MKLSKEEKKSLRWLISIAKDFGDELPYGADVWGYEDELKQARRTVKKLLTESKE